MCVVVCVVVVKGGTEIEVAQLLKKLRGNSSITKSCLSYKNMFK